MNIESVLAPPRIPASDDGVIDKTDIESDIVFSIINYANKKNGDFIKLYMDNNEVGDAVVSNDTLTPVLIPIPTRLLTDGHHVVSYNSTDVAGNVSISELTHVYVDTTNDIDKLPAPSVVGTDDGCLSNDEIDSGDGAIIRIHPSDEFKKYVGKTLSLSWDAFDKDGIPLPQASKQWEWTIDDSLATDGRMFTLDKETVLLADNGGAFVVYYIETGSERTYSNEIKFLIGNCQNGGLVLTLSSDKSVVIADGVDFATLTTTIKDSKGNGVSGQEIHWQSTLNTLSQEKSITNAQGDALNTLSGPTQGVAVVIASLSSINLASIPINFISSTELLPPPTFTQASAGRINGKIINDDGGCNIRVLYDNMSANDVVELNVTGKHKDGSEALGAKYSDTHVMTPKDIPNGYIFTLPVNNALSVNDQGVLHASYKVKNEQAEYESESAEVLMVIENSNKLSCTLSTGAPIYDYEHLKVVSCNRGKIIGQPGISVSISCSEGATIIESGGPEWVTSLNQDGILYFRVSAVSAETITVNIYQVNQPMNSFTGEMQFTNFRVGENAIYAYGYNTGSVADGKMPCSLYVIGTPDISTIRVMLHDKNAEIIGYPNPADIPLNEDQAVEVDIITSVPGNISVQVSAPEASGSYIDMELTYVDDHIVYDNAN